MKDSLFCSLDNHYKLLLETLIMVPVKDVDSTRDKCVDKVADSFAERILKRQGWKPGQFIRLFQWLTFT